VHALEDVTTATADQGKLPHASELLYINLQTRVDVEGNTYCGELVKK